MPRKDQLIRKSTLKKMNDLTPQLPLASGESLPLWIVPVEKIYWVPAETIRDWCRWPYNDNVKGCHNSYNGKCTLCDGEWTRLNLIDEKRPKWIIYNEYNLAARAAELKADHPSWSERKARCIRYWQGTSLSQMDDRLEQFIDLVQPQRHGRITYLAESDGVNYYRTARAVGIHLERIRGMKICRHMVLICYKRSLTEHGEAIEPERG